MRRWIVGVLAAVLAVTLGACSSSASQSTTMQTNNLTFNNQTNATTGWQNAPPVGFTFSGDYTVTSGQPWGGVTGCPSPVNNCQLTVEAGRQKSTPVAQWFTQNAPAATCTYSCGSSQPDELNFAFTGTLTIGTSTYQVAVGQGSYMAGANNWWIGGPGWTSYVANGDASGLLSPDGQYVVGMLGDNPSFAVTLPVS